MDTLLAGSSLFHDTSAVLWLATPLLALVGVTAAARDHVFAAAALSHAAVLGLVIAVTLPAIFGVENLTWISDDALKTGLAVILATATAFALQATVGRTRESMNAIFAWTVLGAASTSCLLIAHHQHAGIELRQTLTSTVLTAQPVHVLGFALALLGALALVASSRRKLVLLAIDPRMAEAVGMRVTFWAVMLPVVLGIVVGLALRATGLLYTFGCLVLAPLAARSACREIGRMFCVAPLLAAASAVLGLTAAARHQLPPAQLIVLAQCALLPTAWTVRRFFRGD